VRSLGYRNALRSYRPRFFAVHIGDPPRIRPPLLNHKRFRRFNMFSDGHLELTAHNRLVGGSSPPGPTTHWPSTSSQPRTDHLASPSGGLLRGNFTDRAHQA